jgi:pimeloyl-ACP methyl ester carboxylesterase
MVINSHYTAESLISINDRDLYIESHGDIGNPVVVLLHHGLGSTRAWKAQVPAFVAAGYRVILYDRWGYGRSDIRLSLSVPYFEDDLEDLHELINHFGIERVALIGHSDGGTIGLYYTAQFQNRVACLVTVAAHIYLETKMEPGIEGIRSAFEYTGEDRSRLRFREGMRRVHGEKVDSVFNNWFSAWVQEQNQTWDMRPTLRQISCPVLVVQGVDDEHATPQHARDIAEAIRGAELWLVHGARHMLPQEYADEFNQRVIDYLSKSGS